MALDKLTVSRDEYEFGLLKKVVIDHNLHSITVMNS